MARGLNKSKSVLQLHIPDGWPNLGSPEELRFRWARYDGSRVEYGVSSLREIRTADEVIAVAPMSRVLFVRAKLPAGSIKKIEKMLPFLVEEQVASAPEELQTILVERRGPEDESLLAVADKTWVSQAAGELDVQGFEADRMIIESELLNGDGARDAWTVVRTHSGGFLHFGDGSAVVLDGAGEEASIAMPPLGLTLALDERNALGEIPDHVRVLTAATVEPPDVKRWQQVLNVNVLDAGEWQPERIDARGLLRSNLLVTHKSEGALPGAALISRFRVPLMVTAAVLAIHAIVTIGDWMRLRYEASTLQSEMRSRFAGLFPDAKIVDPALQLTRNLADLRRAAGEPEAGDFVPLLAQVAPRLTASGLKPQRFKYERGQLQIELPVSGNESRESLEGKLRAAGLVVRIESITNTTATVRIALAAGTGA